MSNNNEPNSKRKLEPECEYEPEVKVELGPLFLITYLIMLLAFFAVLGVIWYTKH